MRLSIFVGARPNFVKAAPILRAAKNRSHECFLIHTGQHYDYDLNKSFFEDLCMQDPDYNFNISTSSDYGSYMSRMINNINSTSKYLSSDFSIVLGDTDSSLAAAIGSKKYGPLVHVEAGLRSKNISMREEYNRVLIDNISDILFCTENRGVDNLINEKLQGILVGNVMIDSIEFILNNFKNHNNIDEKYAVLTIHRSEKSLFDLRALANNIKRIADNLLIIFPMHPRLNAHRKLFLHDNIRIVNSMRYSDFVFLLASASCVFTDSGGVQEETSFLGTPCFTLRDETERPITVELGTNSVVGKTGTDYFSLRKCNKKGKKIPFWDGKASERIISYLEKECL